MNKQHKVTSNTISNIDFSDELFINNEINMFRTVIAFFSNLIVYVFSYFLFYYIQRETLLVTPKYIDFLYIYVCSWLISSFISRKFRRTDDDNFWAMARRCITSFFIMLSLLTLSSYLFEIFELSRIIILGSLFLSITIELIVLKLSVKKKFVENQTVNLQFDVLVFIREFFILSVALLVVYFVKFYKVNLNEVHFLLLVGVYLCWLVASIFSNLFFHSESRKNFIANLWPYIKSYFVLAVLVAFIVFLLRTNLSEQLNYLFGIGIYGLSSFLIFTFVYISSSPSNSDEVKLKILKATKYDEIKNLEKKITKEELYKFSIDRPSFPILKQKLKNVYLKKIPNVFEFIDKSIDLSSMDILKSVSLRSADPYNVEVLPDNHLQFFLNLHEVNDMRRLNSYFISVNKRLEYGGIYISKIEPVKFRYKRFLQKYPYYISQILYFVDFIWRRVCPKLPIVQKFYFSLTKGRNRALSLAEGLGRLYFCGFEVIDVKEIDNFIFFIAKKVKEPSVDKNPSYGPLFKMKRIGKNCKPFYVYKMRTMHPYAEYLQQFIYENFSLKEGGKFKDDFRITTWGKIFRKLWIDELPMLINYFRSELKLVGVRPLSKQYLDLYPESLKEKRFKVKPGLVPPFYADLPKTLDEIVTSEERYLDSYNKKPITTDIQYFFKAFYNIFFKKARSS